MEHFLWQMVSHSLYPLHLGVINGWAKQLESSCYWTPLLWDTPQARGGTINVIPIKWDRGANQINEHGYAPESITSYKDGTAIGV